MKETVLPDGLVALREELKLGEVMRLIERTARWVDPETFRLLPVWYPEHARRSLFYKNGWSEPLMNKNKETGRAEHKREANSYANKALTRALGLRSVDRPNWSCCHIWGVDDQLFQSTNAIVQDHRFYSCVANMVLLPTPLKAFTDAMPEVKAMLRICARHLYGWHCDHESLAEAIAEIEAWTSWDAYPKSWPRASFASTPPGVMKFNEDIRRQATKRLADIRSDLKSPGPHYPEQKVREPFAYWKITI
jgi:hypothetical protein